jgi:hypothetical protein
MVDELPVMIAAVVIAVAIMLVAARPVSEFVERHPTVKLAFQPGTFQIEAGAKRLKKIYERSAILAVNREEATTISGGNQAKINTA